MTETSATNPIAVALSGGVDSAVTARLLLQAGQAVKGITFRAGNGAPAPDAAAAMAVRLGIPHQTVDLADLFSREVITPFIAGYARGETPSPCALCNPRIKFGALLTAARALGCERLATGHYVQAWTDADGRCRLRRGIDPEKDQSYFLFGLAQEQLARAVFPLGGLRKSEVKQLGAAWGLLPETNGESQDLCFLPDGDYARLVVARHPELERDGEIVDGDGRVLGRHHGCFRYTPGQRRGLGLGGGPWYVVAVRPATNTVVVGTAAAASTTRVRLAGACWQCRRPAAGTVREVLVQLRYRMRPVTAQLALEADGQARLQLAEPVLGVAAGQAAVWYEQDELLGGGWIQAD
ncbi:MAG: tRNA 2-thiouridine(34) synthase MnmA [Lentisphaeria bacterium]